jgi:hypothetical protein
LPSQGFWVGPYSGTPNNPRSAAWALGNNCRGTWHAVEGYGRYRGCTFPQLNNWVRVDTGPVGPAPQRPNPPSRPPKPPSQQQPRPPR